MRLTELHIGQLAQIKEVDDSQYSDKLLEMGCVPGSMIRLTLIAPLGDPMAYELDGYTLSMRKAEANSIRVKPIKHGAI